MADINGAHPGKWPVIHAQNIGVQNIRAEEADQLLHRRLLQVVVAQHNGCGPEGLGVVGPGGGQSVRVGEDGQIQHPLAQQLQAAFVFQPLLRQGAAGMPQPLQLAAALGQAQQLGGVAQGSQDGLVGVGSVATLGFAEVQP